MASAGLTLAPERGSQPVRVAFRPEIAAAPGAATSGTPAPEGRPETRQAASAAPDSLRAAAAEAGGPVIGAALEWSGAGDEPLDPASLEALPAFLPEAARGAAGEQVRDGIAALMQSVPCARVRTVFDPDSGALELRGHVPDEQARAPLAAALQARVGESLPVRDALRLLPRPQCDVLAGLGDVGLPQSEEQFTDPQVVGESGWVREYAFEAGDRLTIDLEAPDYPSYVYVDYYDGDGNVLHLVPNDTRPLERIEPGALFSVGREDGFELRIAPPFGQDIAVALAVERPLYEGLRPTVEPAGGYLDFLAQRLAELEGIRGEWAYIFVATGPAER
jgi:hypothetical protein